MNAKEYFKAYFESEPELPHSLDAVEFAEYYHKAKSKEEADERLKDPDYWEYLYNKFNPPRPINEERIDELNPYAGSAFYKIWKDGFETAIKLKRE